MDEQNLGKKERETSGDLKQGNESIFRNQLN